MHPSSLFKGLGNYCLYLGRETMEYLLYYPCPGEELRPISEFVVQAETRRKSITEERARKERIDQLVDIVS